MAGNITTSSAAVGGIPPGDYYYDGNDYWVMTPTGLIKITGNVISAASTNGILITGAMTKAISITGVAATGIYQSGTSGVGIYINKTANTAGTLKIHCHQMAASTDDSPTQYANEFKGEFLATSGTMDGIASHFNMDASGTGVLRSVIGVAYLNAGKTLSGTAATGSWISGGLFACSLAATSVLNGTAVRVTGLYGEISNASNTTMTACNHASALSGASKLLVKPVSGECSLLHLMQYAGATTVNQAIYIEGGATVDAFTTIDVAASGKAIETAVVALGSRSTNTTHALHIKIGASDGYIPVYAAATF